MLTFYLILVNKILIICNPQMIMSYLDRASLAFFGIKGSLRERKGHTTNAEKMCRVKGRPGVGL